MTLHSAPDPRRELYPFLYGDVGPESGDLAAVRDAVRQSTMTKCHDVVQLRGQLIAEYERQLVDTAREMANAFVGGGKLLAFGNGGSATDAQDAATDCISPPVEGWRALPAMALNTDMGVVTAVGNDVGFENVFVRQVIAYGKQGDIAVGFSTSGNSPNVLAGLRHGKQIGMMTIGFAGDEGGAMNGANYVDRLFVARVDHIPRIQEGHATLWHTMLELMQTILAQRPSRGVA